MKIHPFKKNRLLCKYSWLGTNFFFFFTFLVAFCSIVLRHSWSFGRTLLLQTATQMDIHWFLSIFGTTVQPTWFFQQELEEERKKEKTGLFCLIYLFGTTWGKNKPELSSAYPVSWPIPRYVVHEIVQLYTPKTTKWFLGSSLLFFWIFFLSLCFFRLHNVTGTVHAFGKDRQTDRQDSNNRRWYVL